MKNTEISKVLTEGKSYRSNSFLLKTLPSENKKELAKPAFISGKKIFKTAALRNKARRRARAAFVSFRKELKTDYHLVFNLYEKVLSIPLSELVSEMKDTLEKSGMLTR